MQDIEANFNEIEPLLLAAIRQEGIISFARFMEIALYYPEKGYYERTVNPIGSKGDFITNVSVGSLFGEMLAFQFLSWHDASTNQDMNILEAGAHDGQLASDIIGCLERGDRSKCHYFIMEPSSLREKVQKKTIASVVCPVKWIANWDNMDSGSFSGMIFSNELLDAFPVHRLRWNAAQRHWLEWGVTVVNEQLHWVPMPKSSAYAELLLLKVLDRNNIPTRELLDVLPDGYTLDISPEAVEWWQKAARTLKNGYLVALDYGFDDVFSADRIHGSLRAYYRHQSTLDVFERPGLQDLTASVMFPSIISAGEQAGLRTLIFEPQSRYFSRLLQVMACKNGEKWLEKHSRQIKTLIDPNHFGRAFRILVQKRD